MPVAPDNPFAKYVAPDNPFAKYAEGAADAPAVATSAPPKAAGTSVAGIEAAAAHGLAPITAGAALGAGVGSIVPGVGTGLGAAAGATAAGLTQLAMPLYNKLAKHLGWGSAPGPKEATDKLLEFAGIPEPKTGVERTVETITGGAAGAGGGAKAAEALSAAYPSIVGLPTLAARPDLQAISGGLSGAGQQLAAEAGGGPVAQMLVGLAPGFLPWGKAMAKGAVQAEPRPLARETVEAGYVLPPAEISDHPGAVSDVFGGQAGKIKLQQEASTRNQPNTNRLASKAIGLPEDTHLTEDAFELARVPAARVYDEVKTAVPEVEFDASFRRAAGQVGGPGSLVEQYFPSAAENPDIMSLRRELQSNTAAPTDVVMKQIANLRHDGNMNLQVPGDASKHATGLAQREAAQLLEDHLEQSVQNAPAYFQRKLNEAIAERAAAQADVDYATRGATPALGTPSYAEVEQARRRVEAANATARQWEQRLGAADERDAANQTLIDRFRSARQLFAKTYDIEGATNRSTGDVSASGVARLYNKGKPLTGEMKTIADAANAFPKSMQVPANFGHSEKLSALDFFGSAAAVLHGNPGVAAGILARPFVRGMTLSKPYQNAILSSEPFSYALPLLSARPAPAVSP